MNTENPFETEQQYSCFHCDRLGVYEGYYKPHEGKTDWYLGYAEDGLAHYACEECAPLLVDPMLISVDGVEQGDLVRWIDEPVYVGPDGCYLAIDTGDVRRVVGIIDQDKRLFIEGKNDNGLFGTVGRSQIEKVEQ